MPSRAGSPNRNKQRLLKALQKEYGDDFEPVMKMAGNASFLQGIADEYQGAHSYEEELTDGDPKEGSGPGILSAIKDKAIAASKEANAEWDRIAKYTTPQLKAVEITGDVDVTNHVGLPEVDDIVEEILNDETDTRSEEDSPD